MTWFNKLPRLVQIILLWLVGYDLVPSLQKTVLPVRKKRPPAQPFARAACFFCHFDCAVYPLPLFRLRGLSLTVISTERSEWRNLFERLAFL